MKKKVLTFFAFLCCCYLEMSAAKFGGNKDTVKAIVISKTDSSSFFDIEQMSGEQIIHLIDSLLEEDNVPEELVKGINEYAESQLFKHDYYISLTGFYDESIYPSNSMYQDWDTYNIYPYEEEIRKNDVAIKLVLQDTNNECRFVPPIKGLITSNFGWREGKNHNGMDIDLQVWDPVVASFDGMVRISRYHPGYGRVVVIRHYNGLETLYAHLHRLKVKPGDVVESGQVIGLGGSSGRSTGSHLHFEVRFKGKAINPRTIVDFNGNKLVSDSLQLIKTKWSYNAIPLGIEYHTVSRGEHLYGLAKKYGTTINHLCEINGIHRNKPLRIGQKLRVGS